MDCKHPDYAVVDVYHPTGRYEQCRCGMFRVRNVKAKRWNRWRKPKVRKET